MKKLELKQMEMVEGGLSSETMTGIFCGVTFFLMFSTVLAPLAGATAPGCAIGLAM